MDQEKKVSRAFWRSGENTWLGKTSEKNRNFITKKFQIISKECWMTLVRNEVAEVIDKDKK